jgi:Ni/Co efflux regulator RcnB
MKTISTLALAFSVVAAPFAAFADPHKDESGHGKRRHGRAEYKQEYWDGNCKVERKLEKNGDYKEERKCKGGQPHVVHAPQPVYVPAPVVVETPGVVIHGTVRVP